MNTQNEKYYFSETQTRFIPHGELDDLLSPLHTSSGNALAKNAQSDLRLGAMARLRRGLNLCLAEEANHRHEFLFIPVLIAAGAALWFSLPTTPPQWLLFSLSACAIIIVCALFYRNGLISLAFKAGALVVLGMVLADGQSRRAGTIILDTPVTTEIAGTVERRELDARGNWRYVVALKQTSAPQLARAPQKVSLVARSRHEAVAIGASITGKARLSPPSGPALPGLNDFAFGSYFSGIGATGFFYGAPQIWTDPSSEAQGGTWARAADRWLYALRSNIANRIRDLIGGDAGAFAASIVTDERRAISGETMEALRISGLAHIVAISGLNMALAAGIFFVGMRTVFSFFPGFSQRWPVKKISAFAALLMTFCYYLISGFAVSAERAWLMMSIMLVAVLVDRPSISVRNVALSAIVIIVLSPNEVMGPSFQMSFAATLALVSGYAAWSRWRGERERPVLAHPPWWLSAASKCATIIGGVVVTSLIGGLSTAIYSIEHFHRITTYGLAANLAAMPIMSLIVMPFALMGMLLMPFGLDAPFIKVMGYGMAMVIDIANTVSGWGGDVTIGRQNSWFLAVSTTGFLLLALLRTRLALIGLPFVAAGFVLLGAEQWRSKPDLLIYEDVSLVALLSQDAVATTKQRASGFIYDQWARALPLPERHIPADVIDKEKSLDGDDENLDDAQTGRSATLTEQAKAREREDMERALLKPDGFTCRKNSWCISKSKSGVSVAVVLNSAFAGLACDIANIVVTTRSVPFSTCRSGAILITEETLRRTGSMELWLGDATKPVLTARAAMLSDDRPWTAHRHYDWRDKSFDAGIPAHIENLFSVRP